MTWRWKVYRFGFGCRGAAAYVHLKAKLAKVRKYVVGARDEVSTRVKEERTVAISVISKRRSSFTPRA